MTKQRRRLALVGLVLAAAGIATALVLTGLSASVAYFYTPSDLAAAAEKPAGLIRLGGLVEQGSVQYAKGDELAVDFAIEDGDARTPVVYRGVLPDLFREGQGVVVQGRLRPDGALSAVEVLAKHDENYIPKEVADALKEQGRWRDGDLAAD
ncbi:MAG: cytochrome c maturation protein CcmE [Parvularculaceae bacterium]